MPSSFVTRNFMPRRTLIRPNDFGEGCLAFFLDKILQPGERFIPLLRNQVEVIPCRLQRFWLQLEQALTTCDLAAHDAGALKHSKVFGDGLSRHRRALCQLGDRTRGARAKARQERESCLVSERGEDRNMSSQQSHGGQTATLFARHALRCFSTVPPNHRYSCERLPHG